MIGSLEIDDFTYPLIDYHVGFKKKMDYTGIPAAIGVLQTIKVTYINTHDIELQQWSIDEGMLKDAVLTLFSDGLGERDQRFEFFDVHCTGYEQCTKNLGKTIEKTTTLHLEAAIVRHHGETLEKHWKVTNLALRDQTPITRESFEEEPNVLGYHLEDEEGNRIEQDKIKKNTTIVVAIRSTNAAGETAEIDLHSNKIDYKYNGKLLEDDILEVRITQDLMRVTLQTIEEKQNQ